MLVSNSEGCDDAYLVDVNLPLDVTKHYILDDFLTYS